MVTMHIMGGLGNIMFQIAFIESLGKRYSLDVGYSNVQENQAILRTMGRFESFDICDIFRNVDLRKEGYHNKRRGISHTYEEIIPNDGTLYVGYAVSEKNFYSREFILWLFEPADFIKKELTNYDFSDFTSIHVRRTDYINNPGFVNLGKEYYNRAIEFIGDSDYLVFSDDIDWCKTIFKGDEFFFGHGAEYMDLYLMSKCKNNIIANSTFSWWAAYLNDNPGKKVIAPKEWVADGRCTTDELIPGEWIQI